MGLEHLHAAIESHLTQIESLLPPSYKLTLLARCTREDLEDADILMTLDKLPDIKKAIDRRANIGES